MNHICTWLCADAEGEESGFPQTGELSSSKSHQDIYWRCLLLFFISSRRFNKFEKHILYTNVRKLPSVDGRDVQDVLDRLSVDVVYTDFRYKTPAGYFETFQNQFYEFSILEDIAGKGKAGTGEDLYLIVDSDCIFLKPAAPLFEAAQPTGFISFRDDVKPDYVINGLSRHDLRELYEELMQQRLQEIPDYHLGEFLLCSEKNIAKIFNDFTTLWPQLLNRHLAGRKKFNEEAHTLSYLYFKNGFRPEKHNRFMKRIWTNPLFYRNVELTDPELTLWHLPSEKIFGLRRLYEIFINMSDFGLLMTDTEYLQLVEAKMGVPRLSLPMRLQYYATSYYRAINKRLPWKSRKSKKSKVAA